MLLGDQQLNTSLMGQVTPGCFQVCDKMIISVRTFLKAVYMN